MCLSQQYICLNEALDDFYLASLILPTTINTKPRMIGGWTDDGEQRELKKVTDILDHLMTEHLMIIIIINSL